MTISRPILHIRISSLNSAFILYQHFLMATWKVLLYLNINPRKQKVSTRSIAVLLSKNYYIFPIFPSKHILDLVLDTFIVIFFSLHSFMVASRHRCISSSGSFSKSVSCVYKSAYIFKKVVKLLLCSGFRQIPLNPFRIKSLKSFRKTMKGSGDEWPLRKQLFCNQRHQLVHY